MRFPHEAYARMVAQEKTSQTHHVAKKVAGEKKVVEESAIDDADEDEVEVEDETDKPSEEDDLVE